ncbi:superinfection immunity protein [Arsenicitalea aurantiaca]|uniref:Superinfection immunity protein n=1 Tax=Arsenicitalea aurantiaca TaxID=1783274 RepID=A0A433X2F1_9HYPH|nr:superinfection immunity protein [Arsenicitalea aurantiaca]RUT28241.1 superinfection immunity protein [Arsenicitalea aurantiaca]
MGTASPAFAQALPNPTERFGGSLLRIGFGAIILGLYFVPTIITFRKDHPNKWLYLLLNAVLGVTVIGWVALLILVHLAIFISAEGKLVNNARSK